MSLTTFKTLPTPACYDIQRELLSNTPAQTIERQDGKYLSDGEPVVCSSLLFALVMFSEVHKWRPVAEIMPGIKTHLAAEALAHTCANVQQLWQLSGVLCNKPETTVFAITFGGNDGKTLTLEVG